MVAFEPSASARVYGARGYVGRLQTIRSGQCGDFALCSSCWVQVYKSIPTASGKNHRAKEVPVFTVGWLGMLFLALVIAVTGMWPLALVNISILFGMVVMPLAYYPILRTAADRNAMGTHVNGRIVTILGVVFLTLITVAAVASIPLMILTHGGQP
jgi:Mn2+/Fe2+ NRAMP family transporter